MEAIRRGSSGNVDKSTISSKTEQNLTPEAALALVQPFFPDEWGKLEPKDVQLKIIT